MLSRNPVCRRRGVRRRSLSQRSQVTAGSQDEAALAVLPLHLWGLKLTWASVATALQPGVLGLARPRDEGHLAESPAGVDALQRGQGASSTDAGRPGPTRPPPALR